jgi:hypothetical protein
MKTTSLISVILLFLCESLLIGQEVKDPLVAKYKIGGSSEVYICFSNSDKTHNYQGIMSASEDLASIRATQNAEQTEYLSPDMNAAATGDFNGDGIDEVVSIRKVPGEIEISIPLISSDLTSTEQKTHIENEIADGAFEQLRICAGNFCGDGKEEFALAYGDINHTIIVSLFETDADLNIKLLSKRSISYFDKNFDIASGDVDGDGIDEIVVVKNSQNPQHPNNFDVNSNYNLYVFKYNDGLYIDRQKEDIPVQNKEGNRVSKDSYSDNNGFYSDMRISCGDINADGKDEIYVAFSYFHVYIRDYIEVPAGYHYHRRNDYYLHSFTLSGSGEINNAPDTSFYVAYFNYGLNSSPDSRHITLSLKCARLVDPDRDQLVMSVSGRIKVFGTKNGAKLFGLTDIVPTNSLNVQGNENITIGDLNPDESKLDFKKEIIALESKLGIIEQRVDNTSIAQLQVFPIEKTGLDSLILGDTGAPMDIPFTEGNAKEITISSLVCGDFDLKESEVYYVGTPQVISVDSLLQPLIILNAPPIHFDVLDNNVEDLNDAYTQAKSTSEDLPFYATYSKGTNAKKSTSVEIDHSYGYSSDFHAYAMYGGTGFESSVKASWDAKSSYFADKCEETQISEDKTAYREDWIWCSVLDYKYYKYPIYDHKKTFVGYIAVLAPNSGFRSQWISGNSWDHPGYVFDHEYGNLLSYKPFKNDSDILSGGEGFKYHAFSSVPVTSDPNTLHFNFVFNDVKDAKSTYQYEAGVGADLFTKVGVEGSTTVGINMDVFSASNSKEYRIGVSNDLAFNFSKSSIRTSRTTLSENFGIEGNLGSLKEKYNDKARYSVTPYVYRSQSGAFVLDYMVSLDKDEMAWWKNYADEPDPGFILPWRYSVEKYGSPISLAKKQRTNDIQFYPGVVSPNDTVCIIARVHNYSLKKFDGLLKLDFHLDSVKGEKLKDIYGADRISKSLSMSYGEENPDLDNEDYIKFYWTVPGDFDCSHRIYAVIDPENEITEIHKNNNIGWNVLNTKGCRPCTYKDPIVTGISNFNPFKPDYYPNPVQSYSLIHFSLQNPEKVSIVLFNASGIKVCTIADKCYTAGDNEVRFERGDLPDGVYFCNISAGKLSSVLKMIIIR